MHIAYLIPTYPMPSQTFIRWEIAALEAQGFKIERFSLRRFADELADEADRIEQQKTCSILSVGAAGLCRSLVLELVIQPRRWFKAALLAVRAGLRSERGLLRHLAYLAEACVLRQRLTRSGAQHLHVHFGTNASDVALLCRILGGPPYSITIHGPEEFDAPRPFGLQHKIRHAAFVVAISQFTRSQLYRWCLLEDWRKIHVVYCGLDEAFLSAPPLGSRDGKRFVNVGRLSEQKGQLLLIEAAAMLQEQGHDFQLVIVGDGPLRGAIENASTSSASSRRVRITGYLEQPRCTPRVAGCFCSGLAQLCGRIAGGDHGSSRAWPAGDQHLYCRYSRTGPARRKRLARSRRGNRASRGCHGRGTDR